MSRHTVPPAPSDPIYAAPKQAEAARWRLRAWMPAWRVRWDFALVLVLAAALRLAFVGDAMFLGDQAQLLSLARSALDHGALPVTGIRSSIGTLNPPASIYLLLPFAAFGDPLWATLATALANIAAVAMLYAVANRYAGRLAAFATGLLYATAYWPVWFSRFIWQQNLLAPFVIGLFWSVCLVVIQRRPVWLVVSLSLWAIAVQLHPSAAPLLALPAFGLLLTWRQMRPRVLLLGAAALAVLFLPTLLWEFASAGSDITRFREYAALPTVLDTAALDTLRTVLSPPDALLLGSGTRYMRLYHDFAWVGSVMMPLYVVSALWLLATLGAQVLAHKRRQMWDTFRWRWLAATCRRLVAGPDWRYLALLALWQLMPLLPMFKHATKIHEHYLLVTLPSYFLTAGTFVAWLGHQLAPVADAWFARSAATVRLGTAFTALRRAPVTLALLAGPLLVLAGGQTLNSLAEITTVHSGVYDDGGRENALNRLGLPLADLDAALTAADTQARANHAQLYIAAPRWEEEAFGYLATTGPHIASVYDGTSCLLVPSTGGALAVVLGIAHVPAGDVAAQFEGFVPPQVLSMRGRDPVLLYTIAPGARLTGEVTLPGTGLSTAPQPRSYRLTADANGQRMLLLRWTGIPATSGNPASALSYWYGARPGEPPMSAYTFYAQAEDAQGHALAAPLVATCPELAWSAGEDVLTWLTLPPETTAGRWHVWAERAPLVVSRPTFGPLTLETGDVTQGPSVKLPGEATFTVSDATP